MILSTLEGQSTTGGNNDGRDRSIKRRLERPCSNQDCTVGDCFGRIFCNLARDEPSSLLTEIATTHSKSTIKSLNFSCGMRWLRVAMDIRSATPHHLERRCFVCRVSKELKFAGKLAKTQSCRAKPLLFSKRRKMLRSFSRFERHDSFLFLLPASRIQVTCSACAAVIESCWLGVFLFFLQAIHVQAEIVQLLATWSCYMKKTFAMRNHLVKLIPWFVQEEIKASGSRYMS